MKISEIFYSIQGEGVNVGKPAVFLRTALCNLKCGWCDSRYTWDWENYDYNKEVKEIPIIHVLEEIAKYETKHLVITGGEPLIQSFDLGILLFNLQRNNNNSWYVEVETNGTIKPSEGLVAYVNQWNVSPKTSNSGNSPESMEKPDVLRYFSSLDSSYFKFVVTKPEDLNEIQKLISKYEIRPSNVILMPEGTDRKTLEDRTEWLTEISTKYGYRCSPRLQIILFGNKRGT